MKRVAAVMICAVGLALATNAAAQMKMMDDDPILVHALIEQLEDRFDGSSHSFKYDGQAWAGTDLDKVWLKSEGRVLGGGQFTNGQFTDGQFTDGQHEVLYDRATSTFFDVQAGIRADIDMGEPRLWGAAGIQGMALYFIDLEATAYLGGAGHLAARLKASYDLLLTQRIILQPEIEFNLYSRADVRRGTGSGLSDIDAGLRLRYEITRKLAPYIGVAYDGFYGDSARFARGDNESTSDVRFVFGVRTLF